MNPWRRELCKCVCPEPRGCPMAWSFAFMLLPALACAHAGLWTLATPFLAISATSVLKYRFDMCHALDLWTVAGCVAYAFYRNAYVAVPYICLAYNVAVFCVASHRSCWWHATIHFATGVGLVAWAIYSPTGGGVVAGDDVAGILEG